MDQLSCVIDNFGPLPLQHPASVAELQALVRQAGSAGQALYPVAGQTRLGFGLSPVKRGLAVDLRRLTQVIDYPARDMTITVQAGITVAQLQEILAAENQRLPVDVPQAERATLGGSLATNTSGPRRYGFGTLRDYVIGMTVVNDEGQEVKAGGRVVKNVAGYDLPKLHIGALGTLGVIGQVTLKLRPRLEEHALLLLSCASAELDSLLDLLHRSRTRPTCLELLNTAAVRFLNRDSGLALPELEWVAVVGYEDNRQVVSWQVQQLIKEVRTTYPLEARINTTAGPLWQQLVEFAGLTPGPLTFKANLMPSACAAFCRQAGALPEGLLLQAHAGSGIVLGHTQPDLTQERAAAMLQVLRDLAAAGRGRVILPRCPAAWKESLSVWGPPPADAWLMRAVKQQLDPGRIFNPGRFVDGI